MRRSVAIGVLSCLAVTVAAGAADSVSMPSIWRYAHPEAKALIGIEWERVLQSPAGQQIRAKIQDSEFGKLKGVDLIDDVQRIFISSPGKPEGSPEANAPAVIAVQGNFDLEKLRNMAMEKLTKAVTHQSVEILEQTDSGGTTAMALVSPQTVLLGDSDSVRAALDHYFAADSGQASNPLYERASELAGKNDLWIIAKASPSDFSNKGSEQAPFLNDVESIEAGVSLQTGFGLELNLGTKSDESAQTMASGFQFMLGMMMNGQKETGMTDLTKKLYISTDGPLVHIVFSLDQQEVQAALEKMGPAMLAHAGGPSGKEAEVRAAMNGHSQPLPEPPPPEKRVIRIYGLDEGVREIPFNP